ncbi:MAG TPA: hypothetical protein EYP56_20120 [Planctomycetaceae bacterium]|nr:hypothetical protein [Planctomycetaceae bacterium]HIQ20710.1 hypothetical protein [Planctomycetota bacterium]
MKVFYEFGLRQLNKRGEEICGDSVEFSPGRDSATLVFSDGLGSGVKASILSTLTTRIATRMLEGGLPLAEVVQTVSETLPICRVRKIAYSTFTMAQLVADGQVKLVAYDSPTPFVVRRSRLERLAGEQCDVGGKRIYEYQFPLRPGDWLVLVSDGVLNAGIGGAYPLGWGWDEVGRYLEGHVHESLSAGELAAKLAHVVEQLYEGPPGDDVSIAVVKARWKRTVVLMTGPPVRGEDDERVVEALMGTAGTRVVCGGTTANIVARQLGRPISVDLETGTEAIPATGRIEGIDLVTEGTLTMTQALETIRADVSSEQLKLKVDGASRLVLLLRQADEVRMLVGRALNPAHQNPNLPVELGIKSQVAQALGEELRRRGKEVRIDYY